MMENLMTAGRFTRLAPIPFPRDESPGPERLPVPRIQVPEVMRELFLPARYKVYYGGRAGVKSWSFARALLLRGAQSQVRVLCCREYQTSIKESVHQLLSDQIKLTGLEGYYEVLQTEIRGITGTEFFFAGLKQNINKIKSTEGIDICWIEEGEKVSENSWSTLIPTIRKAGSEIWISFNPHLEGDPTYKRFIVNREAILKEFPGSVIRETSWRDNPWLPKELAQEKDYLARVDKEAYDHVWGGQVQKKSAAQVMHGKCVVDDFVPRPDLCVCSHLGTEHRADGACPADGCGCRKFVSLWNGPYYGADWGFATDPATLIKMWISGRKLYIQQEFWGVGVEINDLPEKFSTVSGAKEHVVRADNARPETISYLQRHGFPRLKAVSKWAGSVEDGIAFLRSFEVTVIHPRCVHTDEESRTYKHKVDPLTGDILPDIVDKNNHCWDAIRYGLEPLISAQGTPGLFLVGPSAKKKEEDREKESGENQAGEILAAQAQDRAIRGGQARQRSMERWLRGE